MVEMDNEFNDRAGRTFESLLENARLKSVARFLISRPAIAVYERFDTAIDAYLDAFRGRYRSLQEYLDEKENALKPLLAFKGVNQQGPVLDMDEGITAQIKTLNAQIYTKDAYVDRDAFAELFVIRLPSAYDQISEKLKTMPDAAKVPAAKPRLKYDPALFSHNE